MNENWRFKGRVRKLEQRAGRRNLGLDHLLDFESYDVEFSPAGQVLRKVSYRRDGSKHGSDVFFYGENGKLLRVESFGATGDLKEIDKFEYDATGDRTRWERHSATGEVVRRGVDTFVDGRLEKSEMFNASGLPIKIETFFWNGKILSHAVAEFYGEAWKVAERWMKNYDKHGRLIETFGLNEDDSPLGDGRYTFEYDDDGRKSRIWSFSDWDDDQEPASLEICEYEVDERGNWIEKRKFHRSQSDERWSLHVIKRRITYCG